MAYTSPFDIQDDDPEFQAFKKQFLGGGEQPNAPGFVTGIKQGLGGFTSGIGQVGEDLGWKNNPIKSYGDQVQANNPSSTASQSWEGFKESPWQGIKEFAGQGIGSTLPSLAAFALPGGQGAAATGLARIGQVARGLPMQTALAAAPIYGQVREDQQKQGFDDIPSAAAAAIGGGIVESKLGIQRVLGKNTEAPLKSFVNELASSPLKTGLKTWGRTGLEEGAEEILQQPMQQLGAHRNPLPEESLRDTAWSGFGGLIGGLAVGGLGGAKMGLAHKRIDDFRQQDLLNPNTPLNVLDDQAKWNQAFIERDQGVPAGEHYYNQRQGEIDQYIEGLVPQMQEQQRLENAHRIFDVLNTNGGFTAEGQGADILNETFGIGQKPVKQQYARAYNAPLETPVVVSDNSGNPITLSTVGEAYDYRHQVGKFAPQAAKVDALGYPLSPYQPVEATQQTSATPSWAQYGVEPTQGDSNVQPTQVAQGSNQAASGNSSGSAGNTPDQPGVGRGGDNAAGAPVGRSGANQPVGNTSGGVGAVTTRPGTKDALKQMALQLAPEDSQEYVDLVNAIDTSKSYAEARKALAKHSKDGLRLAIATAPEQDRKTLQLALGWDNEGNMVGSTIPSYSEIGKQIGKTRQRVQQILSQYGINEQVLNQMAATGQESVGLSEIMPSQQEDGGQHEGTGYRLMNNPNEADDIVDDHQTRKDTQEANRVAAEMGVSAKELSQPSNFQTANEVRAEEIAQANREAHAAKEREAGAREMELMAKAEKETLLDLLRKSDPSIVEEDIRNAREEWSLGGAETLVPFDNLTVSEQASFVKATVSFYTADSSMTAQRYANRLEEILDEAGQRTRSETQAIAPVRNEAGEAAPGSTTTAEEVSQPSRSASASASASASEEVTAEGVISRWNQAAKALGVTNWDGLSSEQQNYILGSGTWEEFDEAAGEVLDEINDDQGSTKFSEGKTDQGVEPQKLAATLRKLFFSPEKFNKLVSIYPNAEAIPADVKAAAAADAHMSVKDVPWEQVQGFAMNGKVYLVAGNIKEGNELGVFLHELGVHVGMEKLIGKANMQRLSSQIEAWAAKDDGSQESKLAKDAVRRAEGSASEDRQQEVIAYFVEEAVKNGVNPTAIQKTNSPLAQWFRSLWAAAKLALRKIGFGRFDQLSAQNIVDLSYGAAKMELTGTWHGTQVGADRERVKFSFGGKNAANADVASLDSAKKLEQDGKDEVSIWQQTGWFKGIDGKWRFEISDSDAAFTGDGVTFGDIAGTSTTLGKLLQHDALFNAYPDLKNLRVVASNSVRGGKYMSGGAERIVIDSSMPRDEAFSTLMHEVQHAVQEKEGFAKGGSPSTVASEDVERNELLAQLGNELNSAVTDLRSTHGRDAYRDLLNSVRDEGYRYSHVSFALGVVDEDALDIAELVSEFARKNGYTDIENAADAYVKVADNLVAPGSFIEKEKRAFDMYQRLSGEVEARNVEYRMKSGAGKVFPKRTEDRKASEQIVKMTGDGGAKFSQADIVRTNPQYRQTSTLVKQTLEYLGNKFQSLENNLMFGHQLAEKAARLMPGTANYFKSVQNRQTERVKHEQEIARIANLFNDLETKQQNALNAFVQKSTMEGKWGFKPTWFEKDVQIAVDATMKTEFDALAPEAQQIVKDMFKFGSEQQKRFDESVNANITDPKKKVKRNQMYGKPYSPLKRFGDHVVVGKSAAFVAEEKANPGSKRLAEMKADPKHYYVEFTDGNWEAIKLRDEMAATNTGLTWVSKPLQLEDGDLVGMNFTMLEKLKKQIEASDSKSSNATKGALKSLANQLYIQQLNQMHANKSQAQRLNVKGADTDMMRAFVSQGRAEAALIANLRTHAETESALQQIQKAAREGDNQDAKTRIANAVLRRHLAMLNFKPTPWQNMLMGLNSSMMLLTSPAYYLTNATQPFVVSLPYMAGRFGGANSWNTLRSAYGTTLELVKLSTLFKNQNLDAAHLKKFDSVGREADALKVLLDENLVNIGMEMELGDIANQSKNPAWKNVQKGMQVLKTGVANVEVLNRLSTAVAGYRLAYTEALNKKLSAEDAHNAGIEYARKVIVETHGDYAGYNAPTVMMQGAFGNLPVKLMSQFKKFQFIQAGLLLGTFRDAYMRGNLNQTEKAAAKAMLKWMLGTQAALAGALGGVTGVPMAILGSILAGAFGDDGEDKEAFLRRVLGGGPFAQLILHGAPAAAGVDISKRVGMGAALDPFRMADPQTDWTDYALSLAGPSAGLASRAASGFSYMHKGQYWKGLEMLMPSGVITNASKLARYESEGLTNSRGDVVMKPEEVSLMTDLMQGLGLETTQLSDRRWKAEAIYDRGVHFKEKTSKLQREYIEAFRDGDQASLAEVRQEWLKLQAERVKQGFKRESMATLTHAPMEQQKRERNTIHGLQSTQTNKKFVESIDSL